MRVGEPGSEAGVEVTEPEPDDALVVLVGEALPVPDDDILPGEFDIL